MVGPDGKEIPVSGYAAHQPFITWLVQDDFIEELNTAIDEGRDVGIIKSRDMGASWLCLTVLHHRWQFKHSETFQEMSRKEELVDTRGDMDTLFEKHRYLLRWQPEWLRPVHVKDHYMLLENKDTGCVIVGESTNVHAGQGGRKTAILLDEFGRVDNGEEIELATADTTACRIFNSTPSGPGTAFHKLIQRRGLKVLRMPWYRHPDKGRDARIEELEDGRQRIVSPWYLTEEKRRSKKDLAQNIDMDFGSSGDVFFDRLEIEKHIAAYACVPKERGSLMPAKDFNDEQKQQVLKTALNRLPVEMVIWSPERGRKPWRIYVPLVRGRPSQDGNYVFGIDISNGSGASNSVITVAEIDSKMIVAEFADAFTSPEELADETVRAAAWFGGRFKVPFICWEANGPGVIYGKKMVRFYHYPRFYCQKIDDQKRNKRTTRYGWHSNKARKELLLGSYREALSVDRIINPSEESLEECFDYIYDEDGLPVPGRFKSDSSGARQLHGDRVISAALATLAVSEAPKFREREAAAPRGSFAHRRAIARKKRRQADVWR